MYTVLEYGAAYRHTTIASVYFAPNPTKYMHIPPEVHIYILIRKKKSNGYV